LSADEPAVEPGLGVAPVPGYVVGVVRINSNTASVHADFINISWSRPNDTPEGGSSPDKRIIKGRPLEVDFDRRINVYNKERPHE
jgi:hypothetical protein